MRPFVYERASDLAQARSLGAHTGQGQVDAMTQFLAGGTTLLDLMKLDVLRPAQVVDIARLKDAHGIVESSSAGLRLSAFAKMAQVADHPDVRRNYPVVAQSLQLAASAQLRNMATLGGNVLQKTRCAYYRDPTWTACNKRMPGSGCAAIAGFNRNHAVLGIDDSCIAQYPGDFAVALMALEAEVEVSGMRGSRRFPFAMLHRPVNGQPHLETTLNAGETIVAFHIAAAPWTRCSVYIKVRDRASYEFAIASAAVALDMDGNRVRTVRIGLGGMAYRPWRAIDAENMLVGKELTEASAAAAAQLAVQGAKTYGHNDYKPLLAQQTVARAVLYAQTLPRDGAEHAG
jgi:xanthine dehydrogenase YagS FAD-binding subunit